MKRPGIAAAVAAAALSLTGGGQAVAGGSGHALTARDDTYGTRAGAALTAGGRGILGNDSGSPVTLVAHSSPAHGSLA